MRFSHRSLQILKYLRAVPSAKQVSNTIIGDIPEPSPQQSSYDLGPFERRPISSVSDRPNGWIRQFTGNLRLEYGTGCVYKGFRPIFNSTDGLHVNSPFAVPTRPISVFRQDCIEIDEAIVLWSMYQRNYYHFLFDYVPKLEIVERAGISSRIPVIVAEDLASLKHYIEAAELGLFGPRKIVIQEKHQCIRARRLYVVKPDVYTKRQLGFPMHRLGRRPDPTSRDRIYVSRGGESFNNRQILNEKDLAARLRPLGFEVIVPGTMPLAAQIDRFARAGIVVGPHGGGLANILFRYGAPMALVEMINDTKRYIHHFFNIATHCGFFYRATLNRAEPVDEGKAPAHADIEAVLGAVEEAIAWEKSN
jgi:hypothetical protein